MRSRLPLSHIVSLLRIKHFSRFRPLIPVIPLSARSAHFYPLIPLIFPPRPPFQRTLRTAAAPFTAVVSRLLPRLPPVTLPAI